MIWVSHLLLDLDLWLQLTMLFCFVLFSMGWGVASFSGQHTMSSQRGQATREVLGLGFPAVLSVPIRSLVSADPTGKHCPQVRILLAKLWPQGRAYYILFSSMLSLIYVVAVPAKHRHTQAYVPQLSVWGFVNYNSSNSSSFQDFNYDHWYKDNRFY